MNKEALLKELKIKVNVTWEDEDTELRLNSIIENAKATLDYKLGAEIDYSIPGIEKSLFLNYCMYAYNNCLNEFDKNYLSEIYQIRIKYEIQQRKALNEQS